MVNFNFVSHAIVHDFSDAAEFVRQCHQTHHALYLIRFGLPDNWRKCDALDFSTCRKHVSLIWQVSLLMSSIVQVDTEQNVVLISIASVADPSPAPKGKHTLHAYYPATEPYSPWASLDRNSQENSDFKEAGAQVQLQVPYLMQALAQAYTGTLQCSSVFHASLQMRGCSVNRTASVLRR
jgi:hypothetical protein